MVVSQLDQDGTAERGDVGQAWAHILVNVAAVAGLLERAVSLQRTAWLAQLCRNGERTECGEHGVQAKDSLVICGKSLAQASITSAAHRGCTDDPDESPSPTSKEHQLRPVRD
jgi:hypothetical protein